MDEVGRTERSGNRNIHLDFLLGRLKIEIRKALRLHHKDSDKCPFPFMKNLQVIVYKNYYRFSKHCDSKAKSFMS